MKKKSLLLLIFLSAMFVRGCAAPAGITSPEIRSSLTSSSSPVTPSPQIPGSTLTPSPSPTLDDRSFWATWLASRPRDMESYGRVYDPSATAELPPRESIGMPIWGNNLPLRVLDHTPSFIASTPFPVKGDPESALKNAGCTNTNGQLDCSADSPLLTFGCEWIASARGSYPALNGIDQVTAVCLKMPPDENEDRGNYLYRMGCAFRRDAGLIMERDGKYSLLETPAQVKALLLPIDSPEKALTYLEMMTGLTATFFPEADAMRLYFVDLIKGTRVEEIDGGFRVNLFHYQQCLCEPWVDSEINLQVDRQGNITWLGALPISMTVGFSCAD